VVQMEMSLESRVMSRVSKKKTDNKNSCNLCYSLLQSYGCGWSFTQIKNLCVSLCVFCSSVLSVVNFSLLGVVR